MRNYLRHTHLGNQNSGMYIIRIRLENNQIENIRVAINH